MRLFRIFSIFLLFELIFSSVIFAQESRVSPELKLGALVSLSGPAAENGKNWLDGARLAVDDLNKAGLNVKLFVEDDATTPSRVSTGFIKLATLDKVHGVVGGTWDFLAETAFPLAERYKVPFICPTCPIEIISATAQNNSWIFTNGLSLASEKPLIKNFLKNKNVKRISLLYVNVPFGEMHAKLLQNIASELGIEVVTNSQISYEGFFETIKIAALLVAQKKPELVFSVLNYEGIEALLQEFEKLHLTVPILMTHTLHEAYNLSKNAKRYLNAFGLYQHFNNQEFNNNFKAKYGYLPYDQAASGYDAILFLAKLSRAKWRNTPSDANFSFEGVLGKYNLPTLSRDVIVSKARILGITDGALAEVP